MIFGDLVGLKLPDICLTGEENPDKTSARKLVLVGDRTRARFVTGAHATTNSTAVDSQKFSILFNMLGHAISELLSPTSRAIS